MNGQAKISGRVAALQGGGKGRADQRITRLAEFEDRDLEEAFRDSTLARDRNLTTLGMAMAALIGGAYLMADYRLFGPSELFGPHLLLRALLVLSSIISIIVINRSGRDIYDLWTTLWCLVLSGAVLAIDSMRPPDYVLHVVLDCVVLMAFFVVFMTRFRYQLLTALLFAVGLIVVCSGKQAPPPGVATILVSIACLCLFGAILSWRFHRMNRESFADRVIEQELREQLESMAFTDALTGIANRRDFVIQCESELERHRRHRRQFSVLLLDLDYFKRINDEFGHSVGDDMLQAFAETLADHGRRSDLAARLGGEEFAILLPETTLDAAEEVASRILRRTRELRVATAPLARVTVSIGVTQVRIADSSVDDILGRADRALYAAKEKGRDRVVSAPA